MNVRTLPSSELDKHGVHFDQCFANPALAAEVGFSSGAIILVFVKFDIEDKILDIISVPAKRVLRRSILISWQR